MTGERGIERSGGAERRRLRFSMRAMLLAVAVFALLMGLWMQISRAYEHRALVSEAQARIMSLAASPPSDVPAGQWQRAVAWTSNLIAQAYFARDENDPGSLRRLCRLLDEKANAPADLATLQWIWEEVEKAPRYGAMYAIRFRDVRLLTKEPITDDDLPGLWSLGKCCYLDLDNTQVTDKGLRHLEGLSALESLSLYNTGVTDEGLRKLQATLPNCRISR